MGEPQATTAMAQLSRGQDFGAVADQYNPPGLLPPAGDLGWIPPGMLMSALDRELRTAPVHKVIGPIALPPQGFFIIRSTAGGRVPRPARAPARQLAEMLRPAQMRALASARPIASPPLSRARRPRGRSS